jgi:class 3 adenylate cyclase
VDFYTILDQVIALLRQRQRVTYRALQRQFGFDDTYIEHLKAELINAQHLAVDEEGNVLVWMGDARTTAPASAPSTTTQDRIPLTYTTPYLAEKILTSHAALEGERKHVTVLFAEVKGSMALLTDRDPEEARQLLDPVLERMMAALITPAVLGLAEGYVQVKQLGPVAVKGVSTPLEVYEVLGVGPVRTRLHAAAARGMRGSALD